MTAVAGWFERAACAGMDTDLWFSTNQVRAREICGGCLVRPECLYDALQTETPFTAYGVRGGLTRKERRSLPALPSSPADAIAVLRELLPQLESTAKPAERTERPMSSTETDSTPSATPAVVDPEKVPVGQLLKWGDDHSEPEVQDQAARARIALHGLRQRYAADQELAAITSEREQLEQRLAALRTREAELVPAKPKKQRKPVDYPAAEVRAWAAANGHTCPPVGRVPKAVVEAWRTATGNNA